MERSTLRIRIITGTLLAVVAFVVLGWLSFLVGSLSGTETIGGLQSLAVAAVLCAALGIVPWHPGPALAVAWVAAIGQMACGLPVLPADAIILVVLFQTGASRSASERVAGIVSAGVGAALAAPYLLFASLLQSLPDLLPSLLLLFGAALVTLILAWTFGLLAGVLRRGREERTQAAAVQQAAIEEQERGRIARDMHDVVAHSLAVIVAQADGARYLSDQEPDRPKAALATISATAREALGDVRLLLERLRHHQGDLPQPGAHDLDALVEQMRGAGLDIDGELGAPPSQLPAAVGLAVYRIVQESLTNALRHGDRSRPVRLAVAWDSGAAEVLVRSVRRADHEPGAAGHGLVGMRERARLAGGDLQAGAEGDDFIVRAALPIRGAA